MIRRRIVALAAALALSFSLAAAAPVAAHYQTLGSCGAASLAEFHGNANQTPGLHSLKVCYPFSVLRLTAYPDGGDPNCQGGLGIDHGVWDDCFTSLHIGADVPSGTKLCLYVDENYSTAGGVTAYYPGNYVNQLPGAYNDRISSLKWKATGTAC